MQERGLPFVAPRRADVDYGRFHVLRSFLEKTRPEFVINAAGYTGKPNVDACEITKADTLLGNVIFPVTAAQACESLGLPYGYVSSGCIYSGARVESAGKLRVEKDLTRPELRHLAEASPESIHGYAETDPPNFTFRDGPCSFYSGSKALAEEALQGIGQGYLWRLRIPFDEFDSKRNYLSKVQRYDKVYDNVNSISHRGDFVNACLDLWAMRAPFGIYNVTNPGFVTTRYVIHQIELILNPPRLFEFWADDAEFYRLGAKTPRSNCVMDCSKLLATGVKMRTVQQAVIQSLAKWQVEA